MSAGKSVNKRIAKVVHRRMKQAAPTFKSGLFLSDKAIETENQGWVILRRGGKNKDLDNKYSTGYQQAQLVLRASLRHIKIMNDSGASIY